MWAMLLFLCNIASTFQGLFLHSDISPSICAARCLTSLMSLQASRVEAEEQLKGELFHLKTMHTHTHSAFHYVNFLIHSYCPGSPFLHPLLTGPLPAMALALCPVPSVPLHACANPIYLSGPTSPVATWLPSHLSFRDLVCPFLPMAGLPGKTPLRLSHGFISIQCISILMCLFLPYESLGSQMARSGLSLIHLYISYSFQPSASHKKHPQLVFVK